ncbi:unnamed protein product [Pleuronectes platessa]|uniref:Uncharacterized protein n=1 Tax=Pleuronectes platessa TaxID=8262 RepID=A0A9N7YGU4_PLEPL|nr:unnamed protein product [Pleuronectes platessa]
MKMERRRKRQRLVAWRSREKGSERISKLENRVSSPHNEEVTTHLVEALAANSDWHILRIDVIVSACKTYFETVRMNFRYSQPDLEALGSARKSSARGRQRRKRLLEARQSVLAPDDVEFWRGITIDMMSDEEDGAHEGVSGWIVRPPSFRSQELSDLCATLQTRLEAAVARSRVGVSRSLLGWRGKATSLGSHTISTAPSSHPPAAYTSTQGKGGIDQVSAAEEGPADQELLLLSADRKPKSSASSPLLLWLQLPSEIPATTLLLAPELF